MIKHIVVWKIKESYQGKGKNEIIDELKDRLEALNSSIEDVSSLEVGKNISASPSALDLVLYSEFPNQEALNNYRIHPEHLKIVEYLKTVTETGHVVDYEL